MTRLCKQLLLGISITLGTLVVLAIVGGLIAYYYFTAPALSTNLAMPEGLAKPGVLVGNTFLNQSIYKQDARLGTISDIALGSFDGKREYLTALVGRRGALFLDDHQQTPSFLAFNTEKSNVTILDTNGDGIFEYLERGGGWQNVSLMDHKGNTIWTYGRMPAVNSIAAGSIDGSGVIDFVVGFNGGGGVRRLDGTSKEIWVQPDGNVWHVELVDINADGKLEIIHSNAAGEMTVRGGDGTIIQKSTPERYFSTFSLARWPTKQSPQYALFSEDDETLLLDFHGKSIAHFKAPLAGTLGHAKGVSGKIRRDEAEFFATLVEFPLWQRSIFYVYAPDNNLVYQEILAENCSSISSISTGADETESFIIGCDGKVFLYSILDSQARPQRISNP